MDFLKNIFGTGANIFGASPSNTDALVKNGLLQQTDVDKAKNQSLVRGLLGAGIGYLAQPQNKNYGSITPYLAKGFQQGMEQAQKPFDKLVTDANQNVKLEDYKFKKDERENKEKFFEVFVDGVDLSTNKPYTEEQREAVGEEFKTRWRIEETRSSIDGIQLYSDSTKRFRWDQLQRELEKVKSLDSTTKRQRLKDIRTRLTELFDDTATQENESASSNKQANYFNRSFIAPPYKSGGTKIMQKRSTQYVDYQRRSQAFELGMRVYPFFGGNPSRSGLVIAIFPAIGMVDVQFPHGSQRYPV